jgi:sugar diacid utilization regulator
MRMAVDRVGISARFDDLRETPQALHFAKMTLLGRPNSTSRGTMFDGTILATATLAAPEVMVKSAGATLACFADLPDEEREILFETFWVWQETDAAVIAAAERLCCHPNTVRYRLRRIEKRPDDLSRVQGMSQNYVWCSRSSAGLPDCQRFSPPGGGACGRMAHVGALLREMT